MQVSEAKQTNRLQERMQVLQEQRESGLTVRAWCAANNVKESNFYYWLREVRKAPLPTKGGKGAEAEHALVRIDLPSNVNPVQGNATEPVIRLQYKGAMLDIPPGTKSADLSMILQALDKDD